MKDTIVENTVGGVTAKQAREQANKIYTAKVESEQTKFLEYCFGVIKVTYENGEFTTTFDIESLKTIQFPQLGKYIDRVIAILSNEHYDYKVSLRRKNNTSDGIITTMIVTY